MTEKDTFLRLDEVQRVTGLPRSTIYELMAADEFPKQVPLSKRNVAWLESEIRAWQRDRVAARDSAREAASASGVGHHA